MIIGVTGGSGFIGSRVIGLLLERDGIGHKNITNIDMCPPDIQQCAFLQHDIIEPFDTITAPYDIVFHCAGMLGADTLFKYIRQSALVNIIGLINVLDLQKTYGRVVNLSLHGDWLNPYMISKKTSEKYGMMYKGEYGTDFISIRPTVVYGPGQSLDQGKMFPTFITKALANEPIPVYGDGSYNVNALYVNDVADFIVSISMDIDSAKLPAIIPVGSGLNYHTVDWYASLIIGLCNSKSCIKYLPMRPGQPVIAKDAGMDRDEAKLYTDMVSLEETSLHYGLTKTIEYYKSITEV